MFDQLLTSPTTQEQQWLALLASVASVEADSFHQRHERYLAQHGCRFVAHVYQEAIVQILLRATIDERYELCGFFRRVMSQSIDAHFGQLDLMDHSLRKGLADNARHWLAFLHSMSLADKTTFQSVHLGFLTTYGCDFMAQVYLETFEQALRPGGLVAPDRIQAAFDQSAAQALSPVYKV